MVPNVINRGHYINLPALSGDVMYCNKLDFPIDAITNESPGRPKYNTLPTSLYVRIVGEGAWQIMSNICIFCIIYIFPTTTHTVWDVDDKNAYFDYLHHSGTLKDDKNMGMIKICIYLIYCLIISPGTFFY